MNDLVSSTFRQTPTWIAAVLTGAVAVLYAQLIGLVQRHYFLYFRAHPILVSALAPLLFWGATALVRKFGPHAKGSGIPQVLEAIHDAHGSRQEKWNSSLVSLRTAVVKVLSSVVGILGGASIGREGPTVQISASLFAWVSKFTNKIELSSFLTAGAAAGVAAAFNTPLAGITFAIEEIMEGSFGSLRQMLMLAVILSGITAQAFLGDYLYFGHPIVSKPDLRVIYEAALIGVTGGILGGIFARTLAYPSVTRLPKHWGLRTLLCGVICGACCYFTNGATSGSGYEVTSEALRAATPQTFVLFPLLKLLTTILSYLSGMAGGIFSPSLSIGAGIGISLAELLHWPNFRTCALIGMVAFFSGAIQAPFTAVIIVTEMTDERILILPFMMAGFLGQSVSRRIMPTPLYHFLAKRKEEA